MNQTNQSNMSESIEKLGACSICGSPYDNYGNNPEPAKHYHERCCDKCNWEIVIPMRIRRPALFLGPWSEQVRLQQSLREADEAAAE